MGKLMQKNRYTVNIEETLNQDFEVYAESADEAAAIAAQKYKDGKFVLECGNVTYKQLCVFDEKCASQTEWIEF